MIRVVIAEDQSLLRGALATLLDLQDDIDVVAQARDGEEALTLVRQHTPDILLTDIEMPGLTGLDLADTLRAESAPTRILIVTTFARPGYLQRAMRACVTGYVLKDIPSDDLADAVRKVSKGQTVISPDLAEAAWAGSTPLNDRERQILQLAETGATNKEIARTLSLSPGTVRNYLADATQKLGAANRIEAFRIARDNGWL